MTADQLTYLFDKGELGPASTKTPSQLQCTTWICITFFLGKRCRLNQLNLKTTMLILQKNIDGRQSFEIDKNIPGAVLPIKNDQGGLQGDEDESEGKYFASLDSRRCPVATLNSETSLESYNKSATFKQKEAISDDLSQFIDKGNVQPAVSTQQNNIENSFDSNACSS